MTDQASSEVDRLAKFILESFPDQPGASGTSESAVDVAIRLLGTLRETDATALVFRRRFGELAAAVRNLVAIIGGPETRRLDPREADAFHEVNRALPEPKNAPVELVRPILDFEKAAAACAILADIAETFVGKLEGPEFVLNQLADAIGLALEARGEAGPGEAPGFKVGKCYRHACGDEFMIVGRARTIGYGECLVAESNRSTDLKPVGADADAAAHWTEISREEFAENFGD